MSPQLRIAVDARPLAFPNSGIGRYTSCILSELASIGTQHRFLLYCDRPVTLPFLLPSHWRLRTGNVTQRAMSTPFAQSVFPLWAVMDGIDVFWSPRHHLPLLLPPNIRKVVTVHDLVWKRFPETMTRGGKLIESVLMPASLRMANRIIAVSNFTRQEIIDCFPASADKIDVIYEASCLQHVNTNESSAAQPAGIDKPYFLFVGSSEPRKNLAGLLDAYRCYRADSTTPIDLVLAGSYQWGDFDLQHYILNHDLGRYVHFVKDIEDQALARLYAKAHALVMPSLYEGFGLPLVEAMQWGIPILTSDRSAMPEVAGNAALIVDPLDTKALGRALTELVENSALYRQLADNSRQRNDQFHWRRSAVETLGVFTS